MINKKTFRSPDCLAHLVSWLVLAVKTIDKNMKSEYDLKITSEYIKYTQELAVRLHRVSSNDDKYLLT